MNQKVADWIPLAKEFGAKYGLDPALLLSFIEHESSGKQSAIRYECCQKDANGKCIKGTNFGKKTPCPTGTQRLDALGRPVVSRGPFQFLIGAAEQYGVPASQHERLLTDARLAIEAGAKMLADLSRKFDGELYYIAAAYNGGSGNKNKGTTKHFLAGEPVSNDAYAQTALKLYNKWKDTDLG